MENQIERKYRKTVNRNGWMRKLQLWTLGTMPEFTGYCPMFWVTWFCILISPITLVSKFISFIFNLIYSFFESDDKEVECEAPDYEQPIDEDIIKLYNLIVIGGAKLELTHELADKLIDLCIDGFSVDIIEWALNTPNWQEIALQAAARIQLAKLAAEKLELRKKKREKQLNLIVNYTSWVVKPGIILIGLFGIYEFLKLLIYLISLVTLSDVLSVIGVLIGGGITIWICSFIIAKIGNVISVNYKKLKSIPKPPKEIKPSIFDKVTDGLCEMVEFIWETIRVMYVNHCPLIIWTESKEETSDEERDN